MNDRELLRQFIVEAIGAPKSPAQILSAIVGNVDQLMIALRVTRDKDKVERLLAEIKRQVTALQSRAGGTDLFEDVLIVLETLLGKIEEFVDSTSFWKRPAFLGREKYMMKMATTLEDIVDLKRTFTDKVKEYRTLRDDLKKVKVSSTPDEM